MRKSLRSEYLLLSLICLFHIAVNSVWILKDFSFWYVPHNVYTSTMEALIKLTQGRFVLYPLYSAISAVFLKIFGCEYFIFSLTTSLFLMILIISVYGICRIIGYSKAGILAAFFVSFYPIVFATSRWHDYHVPLIAVLTLTNCILLMANRSSSVVKWLLWASVFTLGSLIGKSTMTETLIFYVGAAGGMAWVFVTNVYSLFSSRIKRKSIINLVCLISLGAISVLFTWYYIDPMKHIPYYFSELHNDKYAMGQNPFFAIFAYILNIGSRQAGNLAVLSFLVALGPFMRRVRRYKWFLLLWVFFPLAIFSMVAKKQIYYTNSIFPAFAIVTAIGMIKVQHGIMKAFIAFVILLSLTQYYFLSFQDQSLVGRYVFFPRFYEKSYFQFPSQFCFPPDGRFRGELTSIAKELASHIRGYDNKDARMVSVIDAYDSYRFLPRVFIALFCELYKDRGFAFSSVKEVLYVDRSLSPEVSEQASQSHLDEMGFGYYVSGFMQGDVVIVDSAVHRLFDEDQINSAIGEYYGFIGKYNIYANKGLDLFLKKQEFR